MQRAQLRARINVHRETREGEVSTDGVPLDLSTSKDGRASVHRAFNNGMKQVSAYHKRKKSVGYMVGALL